MHVPATPLIHLKKGEFYLLNYLTKIKKEISSLLKSKHYFEFFTWLSKSCISLIVILIECSSTSYQSQVKIG